MRTIIVLVAPIDLIEAGDDVLARLFLVVGRDGIFAIEEDDVGFRVRRFFEHAGVRPGHGQFRTLQARARLLDQGEAHGSSLLKVTIKRRDDAFIPPSMVCGVAFRPIARCEDWLFARTCAIVAPNSLGLGATVRP